MCIVCLRPQHKQAVQIARRLGHAQERLVALGAFVPSTATSIRTTTLAKMQHK